MGGCRTEQERESGLQERPFCLWRKWRAEACYRSPHSAELNWTGLLVPEQPRELCPGNTGLHWQYRPVCCFFSCFHIHMFPSILHSYQPAYFCLKFLRWYNFNAQSQPYAKSLFFLCRKVTSQKKKSARNTFALWGKISFKESQFPSTDLKHTETKASTVISGW